MTLVTNVRMYNFELSSLSGPTGGAPYTIQFRYSPIAPLPIVTAPQPTEKTLYKLSGMRALRPTAIHDDGVHTYIQWRADQALPATYALDDVGRETLANGNMRDGVYVLDSGRHATCFPDRQAGRACRPDTPSEWGPR